MIIAEESEAMVLFKCSSTSYEQALTTAMVRLLDGTLEYIIQTRRTQGSRTSSHFSGHGSQLLGFVLVMCGW